MGDNMYLTRKIDKFLESKQKSIIKCSQYTENVK